MSNASFKRYKVGLEVGRNGVEVEVIVSAWSKEDIKGDVEFLYGDRGTVVYCEEIAEVEDK